MKELASTPTVAQLQKISSKKAKVPSWSIDGHLSGEVLQDIGKVRGQRELLLELRGPRHVAEVGSTGLRHRRAEDSERKRGAPRHLKANRVGSIWRRILTYTRRPSPPPIIDLGRHIRTLIAGEQWGGGGCVVRLLIQQAYNIHPAEGQFERSQNPAHS